jgi:hypothetical protein
MLIAVCIVGFIMGSFASGPNYLGNVFDGDAPRKGSMLASAPVEAAEGLPARAVLHAADYSGSDCGAKISAALSALGGAGEVIVPVGCGAIRTQVRIGTNQHLRLFAETYQISSTIIVGQDASLECPPTADIPGAGHGTCLIQAAAGSNLPVLVLMNGTNAALSNVTVDGQQFASVQWIGLRSPGQGYISRPACRIIGDGSGATCILECDWTTHRLAMATLTSYGHGYTHATVMITGGGGSGASIDIAVGPNLNASAGANIKVLGVRSRLDHVNSIHAATHGIQIGDPTRNNVAAATKLDHVMSLFNSGDGIYGVNTTDAHLGGQSEVENNLGIGVNLFNCGAWRIVANDIGGNAAGGIKVEGTIDSVPTTHPNSFGQIILGNQFGNNGGHDIDIEGYDHMGRGSVSLYNTISSNQFIGSWLRVEGSFDAIHIEDSGANSITANTVWQGPPSAYRNGIGIYESAQGRELTDTVASNTINGPKVPILIAESTLLGANDENGTNEARQMPAYWLNNRPWGAMDSTGARTPLGLLDERNRVFYYGHRAAKQMDLQPKPGTSLMKLDGNTRQVSVLGLLTVSRLRIGTEPVEPDLRGVTGPIGGSPLRVGHCATGDVAVPGAQAVMITEVSPVNSVDPGDPFYVRGYVSSQGIVTVKICAAAAATPRAARYAVRLRP